MFRIPRGEEERDWIALRLFDQPLERFPVLLQFPEIPFSELREPLLRMSVPPPQAVAGREFPEPPGQRGRFLGKAPGPEAVDQVAAPIARCRRFVDPLQPYRHPLAQWSGQEHLANTRARNSLPSPSLKASSKRG